MSIQTNCRATGRYLTGGLGWVEHWPFRCWALWPTFDTRTFWGKHHFSPTVCENEALFQKNNTGKVQQHGFLFLTFFDLGTPGCKPSSEFEVVGSQRSVEITSTLTHQVGWSFKLSPKTKEFKSAKTKEWWFSWFKSHGFFRENFSQFEVSRDGEKGIITKSWQRWKSPSKIGSRFQARSPENHRKPVFYVYSFSSQTTIVLLVPFVLWLLLNAKISRSSNFPICPKRHRRRHRARPDVGDEAAAAPGGLAMDVTREGVKNQRPKAPRKKQPSFLQAKALPHRILRMFITKLSGVSRGSIQQRSATIWGRLDDLFYDSQPSEKPWIRTECGSVHLDGKSWKTEFFESKGRYWDEFTKTG